MKRAAAASAIAWLLAGCGQQQPAAHADADWEACETSAYPNQRIEACTAVIENVRAQPERRAAALVNRGSQRANLGQHARAIADFGRALRLSPHNAHAFLERGLVHETRGAYEDAVRAFDAALAIEPTMQMAIERRQAAIAGRQQAGREQLTQITQALAQDPRNAELLNARCWLLAVDGGDLDQALADCNAALAVQPAFAAALDSRGLVQLKRGDFAASLADYEAALKVEPQRGHYLYGRGLARLRLGMKAEGESDLAAAELAEPGIAALYHGYGVGPAASN